jgi:hypothetical protein
MCTLWEIAETIRADEAKAPSRKVDTGSAERVNYWCRTFGTSPHILQWAISSVGSESSAIVRFLRARAETAPIARQSAAF